MFKKILALVIAVMMIMSVAVIAASAEQVEIADQGADAAVEVAADAGADSGAGNTFTFDVSGAGWNNFSRIFCHIFVYNGDALAEWQTKAERCTDNGDGTWTYDLDEKGFSLESGKTYCIMFSADTGVETYQMLMDSSCIGDTVVATGEKFENPVDSNKTSYGTVFKNADPNKYGPTLAITSIGTVVGKVCPPDTTPYDMFVKFLKETLENARTYSKKSDQQLIDDTASAIGLGKDLIPQAIKDAGVTVDWKAEESKAPEKSDDSAKPSTSGGTSGGTSGDTSGGTSSGSTSKSGTASGSTKTGQETTVLFIMLGVMVAAAGVIFFARKKA